MKPVAPMLKRRKVLHTMLAAACAGAVSYPVKSRGGQIPPPHRFYVSLKGRDTWDGTLPDPDPAGKNGPFRTIERARQAVRDLKMASGGLLARPVVVAVRAGTYYLADTLRFTPEDSGTKSCPITYEAARGETVVLSGGQTVDTPWKTDDGRIYHTDIAAAQGGSWRFRQLFVRSRREVRARYPNVVPEDIVGQGWLYAKNFEGFGVLLAGLAQPGDFAEYKVSIPASGDYKIWIGYASQSPLHSRFRLTINGTPAALDDLPPSGGFRTVRWSRAASVPLTAGQHTMRWEILPGPDCVVHVDGFVLTDRAEAREETGGLVPVVAGEHRVVVQAEDETTRVAGKGSHTVGFQAIYVTQPPSTEIRCTPGSVRAAWSGAGARDATVHVFAGEGWFNEIGRLVSADAEKGILRVEGREMQSPLRAGNRFFVEGVREELDQPGEWHLDTEQGRLWYWPRSSAAPGAGTVIAPRLVTLLHLRADVAGTDRVRWLNFKGFTFAHTDYTPDHVSLRTAQDAAVVLENAHECAVEECRFFHCGGSGVHLHLDSRRCRIAENEIAGAGGCGVLLTAATLSRGVRWIPGAAAATVAPIENEIVRNHIHHCGQIHKYVAGVHLDSRPITLANAPGNRVAQNHIHHLPRNGIFAFSNQGGNTFEYNDIHDVLLESDDAGGIHICASGSETAPTVIRGNRIQNVMGMYVGADNRALRAKGFGIYLDDLTSHCTITNNIVRNTTNGSVYIHGGQDNVIENNILAGDIACSLLLLDINKTMKNNRFRRNIVVCADASQGRVLYADLLSEGSVGESDYNLFWANRATLVLESAKSFADWQKRGFDTHSRVADPLLMDAGNGGYSPAPGSPAHALGFKPVEPVRAGLTKLAKMKGPAK